MFTEPLALPLNQLAESSSLSRAAINSNGTQRVTTSKPGQAHSLLHPDGDNPVAVKMELYNLDIIFKPRSAAIIGAMAGDEFIVGKDLERKDLRA